MTDKQIIIDGCDVSGCVYHESGYCTISKKAYCYCSDKPNCYYKQLKRKEQECEELKKIINEAKNSKLDLKSFLVGEAVQNEYEQQLDQLKAELTRANCQIADDEILQCDMREAIEELKAENDLAKQLINWILKFFELTDYDWQDDQNEISALIEDYIDDKNSTIDFVNDINKGLLKTLTKIKEIAEPYNDMSGNCVIVNCFEDMYKILQKISEVENEHN